VSLSDITQLLGTSVPVVVAGSVLGVFELGERLASQRAKDALSQWLLSFDVRQAGALPDGTQELFERIFGERHFSVNCFWRSVAFSFGAVTFLGILVLLIDPNQVIADLSYGITNGVTKALLPLALWLPWMILIDYISLFKTRVILRILARLRVKGLTILILLIDYLAYTLLFLVGTRATTLVPSTGFIEGIVSSDSWSSILWFSIGYFIMAWSFWLFVTLEDGTVYFVLFWSGFAPSIWTWLYVLALFVTRGLLRSERVVNWLRWFLDVEKNPFRSIGAVAAALAFIASVAIILVSAEVSRMSTVG
jgi:hypothetical protein